MDARTGAKRALAQLLEPLAGFALDSGLSIREFDALLRSAAVRSVAARQLENARRVNISGIAASTGLSRSEISRILKSKPQAGDKGPIKSQQSTHRILSAWQREPKFTTPNGAPADLKLYGRGATFESLVRSHGKGIPTRAILDELVRTRAVELRSAQTVRLKAGVTVERGLTRQGVKAFGERVSELMNALLENMRDPDSTAFVAHVSDVKVPADELPLLRREISSRGAEFLNQIHDMVDRGPPARRRAKSTAKNGRSLSVTICYHEAPETALLRSGEAVRRRNFRRR